MKRIQGSPIAFLASSILIVAVLSGSSSAQMGLVGVERIHDFGEVGIDYDLFHTFEFVNHSDKPVQISSVQVTCDCSSISFTDSLLAPGDTGRVRLKFNTKNYYGEVSKAIIIHSDSPLTPKLDLFYTAIVGQWYYGLKPNPVSLFFLPRGKAKTVRVVNRQLPQVEISEILNSDSLFSATIEHAKAGRGDTLSILVTPSKTLTKGTYFGNFRFKLKPNEDLDPVHISIPVKIVRY